MKRKKKIRKKTKIKAQAKTPGKKKERY